MSKKEVIILQYVSNENAGTIFDYLIAQNIPHRVLKLYEKDSAFPDMGSIRSVVSMGGPMNVYEEDKHPFLKREDEFIKNIVQRRIHNAFLPSNGFVFGGKVSSVTDERRSMI